MLQTVNRLKLDLFWALITANANMADGVPLFNATHTNLAVGGDIGAPSVATLGAMRTAFRVQTPLGGTHGMNLIPTHLIIPAAYENAVESLVSPAVPVLPAAVANAMPRFIGSLSVIVEPRLDANSTTRWYAFSRGYPSGSFVYGSLEGQPEPAFATKEDFDTRGIKARVDIDFGCGVTDHRAVYANNGV